MITLQFSPVDHLPDAPIRPLGRVSTAFYERGIQHFRQAAAHVRDLPYGHNRSSEDSMVLFADGFGTCLTKHGVMARLAAELELPVHRYEGFYALDETIMTGVGAILSRYELPFVPRMHCFLRYEELYFDLTADNCTGKNGTITMYFEIGPVSPEHDAEAETTAYARCCERLRQDDERFAATTVSRICQALQRCQELNVTLCPVC